MLLATQLPDRALAQVDAESNDYIDLKTVRHLTIPVGATKPFKALHLSDTHLTRVDDRDNERKHKLAESRRKVFPMAERYFDAAIRYAAANKLMMLHTGDLQDFVSYANLDCIAQKLGVGDWFTAAGNHEYSQYVGEAREDEAYKAQSYDKVQAVFPNDLTVASRIINGVNFVAIDNVYYYVTAEQHQAVKREFEKGLPVVLMCHIPFYTPEHCQVTLKKHQGRTSYMVATPPQIINDYRSNPDNPVSESHRNRPVPATLVSPATQEFYDWLKEQPQLKAILCGHMHEFFEERFSPTAVQYTVGANYFGYAQEIEFI